MMARDQKKARRIVSYANQCRDEALKVGKTPEVAIKSLMAVRGWIQAEMVRPPYGFSAADWSAILGVAIDDLEAML